MIWNAYKKILNKPPHYRDIFIFLLCNANKKGEVFIRRTELIEKLSWHIGYIKKSYSQTQYQKAMEFLYKVGLIKPVSRTDGGATISVCNYKSYGIKKGNEDRKKKAGEETEEVMEHLRKVTGKELRNYGEIETRIKEGANTKEMIRIIDIKSKDPHFTKENFKYLNATTLFRKKNYIRYLDELENTKLEVDRNKVQASRESMTVEEMRSCIADAYKSATKNMPDNIRGFLLSVGYTDAVINEYLSDNVINFEVRK